MTKIFAGSCLLLAALLTLPAPPVRAQDEDQETRQEASQPAQPATPAQPVSQPTGKQVRKEAKPTGDKVSLDFKDIELADLIQTVSELTGKNFLYDDSVKGKATIISPAPMSLDEAYKLFLTVLNVKGFTVVPSGQVYKVVPLSTAKENNLPLSTGDRKGYAGDQFVTRLVPLSHIDANLLATTVLAPLVPKTSNVVAYAPSNTLIITDSAANIDRLLKIIRELDVPSGLDSLEVIPLQFASADEVAQVATQVLSQVIASPRRGRSAAIPQAGGAQMSKVIPFARTNSLVVMATLEDLETVKRLVADLDSKPSRERSNINVYYLENADAETLAKTLNEILTGIKAQTQGRTTGRAQQAVGAAATGAPLSTEPVSITADKPTNSLIINATPEDFTTIKGIISQLDIKRKQVYVEALILELSMDATQALGASLQGAVNVGSDSLVFGSSNLNTGSATLNDLAAVNGVPSLLGKTIEGILLGGLFNPITVTGLDGEPTTVPALSALIDLSKKDSDINILSAPRLLTSDNEEAEIIVGSNVPIITQRLTDTGGTGLAQSVSVERKDVALTLRFTPQVTEGNLVRLNVYQEITDLAATSVGNVNEVGPTLTKRLVRNTVLAENGRTVVLGGLIGTNQQKSITKVPLLGDIPGLGWLFKRSSTTEKKTNLLIFITPKIIKNAEDLADVTRSSHELMTRAARPKKGDPETVEAMAAQMLTIDPAQALILPPPPIVLPQDAQ